jgi:PST family polysaccharide transporter
MIYNLYETVYVKRTMKKRFHQSLRWSEKYIKTDMVYLVSGGFWLSLGQVVGTLFVFGLSLAFANLASPETYGTYKYLLSLAAFFSIFTLTGMSTAINRAVARGDKTTIRAAIRLRVWGGFIGAFFAFCGSGYYFIQGNIELAFSLAMIGIFLPVFDTFLLYRSFLSGIRDFKKQVIFDLFSRIVSTAALITALFFTNDILIILLAYFLPLSIIRFVLYRKISTAFTTGTPDDETLSYGKKLSAMEILGVAASNVDKILLWKFLGPAQVAIYTLALALPEQIKGPLKVVSEMAFPKFSNQTPEQIQNNLPALFRKLLLYAVFILLISLAYIIVAPFLYKILFPQYIESVVYSQVFMLASVALVVTVPLSLLSAQKKMKEQYLISIAQPIIQIAVFVALIPPFGIWGAIAARLLMRVFFISFTLFLTYRAFRS